MPHTCADILAPHGRVVKRQRKNTNKIVSSPNRHLTYRGEPGRPSIPGSISCFLPSFLCWRSLTGEGAILFGVSLALAAIKRGGDSERKGALARLGMKNETGGAARAALLQEKFCRERSLPRFAPHDGVCFRCGNNIYRLISPEEAGRRLVTRCPFCSATFVD